MSASAALGALAACAAGPRPGPLDRARATRSLASCSRASSAERASTAPIVNKATGDAACASDTPDLPALEAQALQALARRGWKPDYLTVRRRTDLQPPQGPLADQPLVVLGAAKLGSTRLIDNLEI